MSKKLTFTITAIILALLVPISTLMISKLQVKDVAANISATRTVELTNAAIDYESILNEFENSTLTTEGSLTTFEGYQTLNLADFAEIDLVSDSTVEDEMNFSVKYNFSYDAETNLVTVSVTTEYEDGSTEVDEISGAAFVNEQGDIDAVLDIDGELILLSELQESGMIENCGWFKKLVKKVAKTVKKVCKTAVGVVGAVATVAVPAVIGVVCAATGVGLVATIAVGAIAGATIAGTTAAASTYQQDGKVDWEAVGICAGIGGAVGAISAGVAHGVTSAIKNAIAASNKAAAAGKKTFQSGEKLADHFTKHGKEFGDTYKTVDEYLDGANYVIENGKYCKELNGYLRFYGANGKANYAFVGMTQDGASITTFGIRSVSELAKVVPWLVA